MPTQNIFDLVDTWNDGATTFTAVKMNVTDTASNASSLLMDLQVSTVSKFKVQKNGAVTFAGGSSVSAAGTFVGQNDGAAFAGTGAFFNNIRGINWSSTTVWSDTADTFLTRRGIANLRLGAADAASGVQAQTLSVQSITGTNVSAAAYPFKITGAQGTGNAAGGSIIFQVAPAGGSGAAQNTLVDYVAINPTKGGGAATGNNATLEFAFDAYLGGKTGFGVPYSGQMFIYNQGVPSARILTGRIEVNPTSYFGWNSGADFLGTSDTSLHRASAGIIGIRGTSSSVGGALSFIEQTAPAAPAANGVYIYAEDDGAGKTRLMAKFATTPAVQIAIEP